MPYVVAGIAVLLIILGIRGTYSNILAGLGITTGNGQALQSYVGAGASFAGPGATGVIPPDTLPTNIHGANAGAILP